MQIVDIFRDFCYLILSPESRLTVTKRFQHGVQLKAATAMVRLRLYSCLLKIPAKQYDGAFANLLRQLGASVLRPQCPPCLRYDI